MTFMLPAHKGHFYNAAIILPHYSVVALVFECALLGTEDEMQ